jgi:hypothetical protein
MLFTPLAAGMGISYLVYRWRNKPTALFEAARKEAAEGRLHVESVAVLKKIYRYLMVPMRPMLRAPLPLSTLTLSSLNACVVAGRSGVRLHIVVCCTVQTLCRL